MQAALADYRAGRHAAVVARLEAHVAAKGAQSAPLWLLCSAARRALGQREQGLEAARRALALAPEDAGVFNELGLSYKGLGRLDDAERAYRDALARAPGNVNAWSNLGVLHLERGQYEAAGGCFEQALRHKPDCVEALTNLGTVAFARGHYAEARDLWARAVDLAPELVKVALNLGSAQRMLGDLDAARAQYSRARHLAPRDTETALRLADLLAEMGRFEEAEAEAWAAAAHPNTAPAALAQLVSLRRMTGADEPVRERAEALLDVELLPREKASLHFSLGKLYDDWGQYAAAFAHYAQGNQLVGAMLPARYDAAGESAWLRQWQALGMGLAGEEALQAARHASEQPVFVVGMPRSGTTLIERILGAHPQAAGAGELRFWNQAAKQHQKAVMDGSFAPASLRALAETYLAELDRLAPGAARVVDKMPQNFMHLGLMHAAFLRARVIHVRRHPVDTCLSIYFQWFVETHAYAYDLNDLVACYQLYQALMDGWRAWLPADRFLEVPYEALVAHPEDWTRRMLAFVGLPWDDACLDFHRQDGSVQTASRWQVRQPLYRTSTERWRRYEPWLGPLRALLDESPREPAGSQRNEEDAMADVLPETGKSQAQVTLDGVAYPIEAMSPEARQQLQNVQATEQEIVRVQGLLGMLQTARAGYIQALKAALDVEGKTH